MLKRVEIHKFVDDEDNEPTANAEEEGTVLKINYENDPDEARIEWNSDENDDNDDDDERDESSPFPMPQNSDTLERTSQSNLNVNNNKKSGWKTVKDTVVEPKEKTSNWKSILNSTKMFLGIDQDDSGGSSGSGGNGQPYARETSATDSQSPIYQNKALNNWNERTFRVLRSNMIFGGKIKEKAVDKYLENLNETIADDSDVFLYYKSTGGKSIDLSKRTGVVDMAYGGIRKAFKVN